MPSSREIKIKLRLDPEDVDKFLSLDALKTVESKRIHFRTVYFDDRKRDLARNGFELRVRSDGSRRVQTLKSGVGFDRGEWKPNSQTSCHPTKNYAPPRQRS
jgi:triphosphatase